jgi:hypothetical protein
MKKANGTKRTKLKRSGENGIMRSFMISNSNQCVTNLVTKSRKRK